MSSNLADPQASAAEPSAQSVIAAIIPNPRGRSQWTFLRVLGAGGYCWVVVPRGWRTGGELAVVVIALPVACPVRRGGIEVVCGPGPVIRWGLVGLSRRITLVFVRGESSIKKSSSASASSVCGAGLPLDSANLSGAGSPPLLVLLRGFC